MFSSEDAIAAMTDVVANCDLLERELLRSKRVVAAAIDAQRPGGSDNPDVSGFAWLKFNRWLHRTHAGGERAGVSSRVDVDSARLEETLAAALSDKPVPVDCADGTTRYVYPKSYDTLRFLDSLDVELRLVTEEWTIVRALMDAGDAIAADRAVAMLAPRMESTAVRLWAWILCDARAELPFDTEKPLPSLPKWTAKLAPEDLIGILRAHLEHARRMQIISSAFPPDPDDAGGASRLTLAGFLGSLAAELPSGEAKRALKSTPLAQIFATQVCAARAHREAMKRAKEPPQ